MLSPRWGRLRSFAAALCVCVAVAACTGKSDDSKGNGGADRLPSNIEPAALRYGFGPGRDAKVDYQPDVIILDGGPKAIRSASADGLTWTVDKNAKGAGDLHPGKIMFATARAVGRIVKVEPAGEDLAVTLAPVQLTEVIKDGEFKEDGPLAMDDLVFQEIPDYPGAVSVPESSEEPTQPEQPTEPEQPPVSTEPTEPPPTEETTEPAPTTEGLTMALPPLRLNGGRAAPMPPPTVGDIKKAVDDWILEPFHKQRGKTTREVGLKASVEPSKGLKFTVELKLAIENLQRHMALAVQNGQIKQGSSFTVDGIKALSLSLKAGSTSGLADNKKIKIEVPIELNTPVIVGGFPFIISHKWKMLVTTGFSAKDSTLTALGSWQFSGPLGFDGTTLRVPTVTEQDDLLKSLQGVSVGVNGIVTAFEYRLMIGFGVAAAAAGPYVKLTVSGGFTNGSDIGMVKCKSVTFIVSASGGVGTSVSSTVSKALKKILGVDIGKKDDFEAGKTDLVNYTKSDPEVAACKV